MARILMIRTVLAGVLCASSAVAWADSFEQTFQFDCDVPAGKMSDWVGALVPRVEQIAGTIELLEPRVDERWWPVASVFLVEAGQKVGLQLYRDRKAQDLLQVAVLRPESEGGRSVLATVPWKASPVAFNLAVKDSGDVELTVAGKVALLRVKNVEADKISLSCSSAQFKFADVKVRSERPQQSALTDLAETLRHPTQNSSCPSKLSELVGLPKATLLDALGNPDLQEAVFSKDSEPLTLLHYDLSPGRTTVTFEVGSRNAVTSASCK